MSSKSTEISVGAYLFKRLHQFGVRGVHGVPGDFNLVLLDLLGENGLYWVGNCNELNAGPFREPIRWFNEFSLIVLM